MMITENECFNCMKTVSCKVTTIENQKEYMGHWGLLGGVGAILGVSGMC